jgi:hypothetical protein
VCDRVRPLRIQERTSLIPGFKTVSMRDVIIQPGSKTMGSPMMNAMICHVPEGELRIEQEGKTFAAKKNFVWTCNKETNEQAYNDERPAQLTVRFVSQMISVTRTSI